ncbi:MAG: pilus assembly protein CpaE, partial [Pseudomonadota bacterium]
MSNENTLFDDDFEIDFDDDLDSDLSTVFEDENEDEIVESVDLEATQKELEAGVAFPEPEYAASAEGGDRAIPAILTAAFCESGKTVELLESVAADRRMSQASVEVHEGGLPAAIEYLQQHATPNLLILESSAPTPTMIAQIDELAGHCDEGVQVMVLGATNDIALYRQLMARGVSEYLVPPVAPVQIVRSISQ